MSTVPSRAGSDAPDNGGPVLLDSITVATPAALGRIAVSGSHGGIVAATAALRAGVTAVVFNDAAIGRGGAGIAGLRLLDEAATPGAAVDYRSANVGDAADTLMRGILSVVNNTAQAAGWRPGMPVSQAVALAEDWPQPPAYAMAVDGADGRELLVAAPVAVWALDSASFVRDADAGAVLATGSHGGLVGGRAEIALKVDALAAIFNDAGGGPGTARLSALATRRVAAATVSASSARIGDGRSTYEDGVLSAVNDVAAALGARPGMAARAFTELVVAAAGDAHPAKEDR